MRNFEDNTNAEEFIAKLNLKVEAENWIPTLRSKAWEKFEAAQPTPDHDGKSRNKEQKNKERKARDLGALRGLE